MYGPGANEELVEFAFVSQVAEDLPAAVLARVARQTWSFNTRMGLTGELSFRNGRFVQVIEGRCEIVQPLVARILADPRHGSIRITAFRPLVERRHSSCTLSGFDLECLDASGARQAANLHFLPVAAGRTAVAAPVQSVGVATI